MKNNKQLTALLTALVKQTLKTQTKTEKKATGLEFWKKKGYAITHKGVFTASNGKQYPEILAVKDKQRLELIGVRNESVYCKKF